MKNWIVNVITIGMVLCLIFIVGLKIVEEQKKSIDSFCLGKTGIQKVESCDYHLPFVGGVGCYIYGVDCGEQ
ncbi:MAG: hypothetical protein ACTSPI_16960 [Candidatus Heimdallarchaeaceae archaeon]